MYIKKAICIRLNLLAATLLTVPVIWGGAWLSHQDATRCDRHLNAPFLVLGIFLLLLSSLRLFLSLIIIHRDDHDDDDIITRADNCICFCLLVIFFVLLGYTLFALIITGQAGSPSKALRHRATGNHWRNIKDCFVFEANVCSPLVNRYKDDDFQQFQARRFSSIQSGCCKPPQECNFTYTSPAVWAKPTTNGTSNSNPDCVEWNNDPYILCFNCQSCKDGFLHDINMSWKKTATVNIVVIISLVMLCWCGDCGDDPED